MTVAQVIQVAYNAGFRGASLVTAVAIAIAESGLNPIAINNNLDSDGNIKSVDRGLWQINSYWHPQYKTPEIFNSDANARAAFAISKSGTNFKPWVTFNEDLHLKYIDQVTDVIKTIATAVTTHKTESGIGIIAIAALIYFATR